MASAQPRRRFSATTGVLIVLCIMSYLMYVDRTNISTAALAIRHDLHLNNSQLGIVFAAFALTYAVAMIPGGVIADRLGSRKMLAICGLLWGFGTLLTGLASGFAMVLLARFIVGLGESPIVPTSARAMTAWMKPEQRGFAQGITHSAARLGNAITPPLVAWLIALTTAVFGDGEFAVRLSAPLLHAVTAGFVYATGARLYDGRVGFWAPSGKRAPPRTRPGRHRAALRSHRQTPP